MRIVDADRLKRSFEANTPIAFQDCVPGIHSVIDLEPTVEAIPVEWIKQRMLNVEDTMLGVAYSVLISEWEDEQAERKEE